MKFIYFDESKNDGDYPSYHIGAVVVDDFNLFKIEDMLNQIAENTFGTSTLNQDTEFHAAEIFHRSKNFKDWNNFDERINLLSDLIDILNLEEVQLIDIQINCNLLTTHSMSPEEIAFMFLCEKASSLMVSENTLGILIGDRENDRSAAKHAGALSNYKQDATEFSFGRRIENLVDSVHFTQSHLSRFLQLADIYVWVLQFKNRNKNSDHFRHKAIFDLLKNKANLFPNKYKIWPK